MQVRSSGAMVMLSVVFLAGACGSDGGSTGTGGNGGNGGLTGARSGGATGSGGSASGGVTGSGGAATTGGSSGSGGAPGTGGAPATGGASTGGATAGAGGAGGAAGAGGIAGGGGNSGTGGRGDGGRSGTGGRGDGGRSGTGGRGTGGAAGGSGAADPMMNFFVTSSTSTTANLGGLAGADAKCQSLAAAVGQGAKTWRAYLSAATPATNARDRIGAGPYFNAQGTMIAADKDALHARAGDAALFLTEQGARVNGQWTGSPTPNQHDILTGTQRDGTLATGMTCGDWTATTGMSQVGHSDGLGPNQAVTGTYSYWNSSHTGQCGNTSPGGGAGQFYCFVAP